MKSVVVGYLVMLTVNSNLKKGLANELPTFIWYINPDFQGQVQDQGQDN